MPCGRSCGCRSTSCHRGRADPARRADAPSRPPASGTRRASWARRAGTTTAPRRGARRRCRPDPP
ncbi:hypothetical protein FJZ36_14565 [Candidatus Poribacteria bacterium]|nr:hypothetical protein [Candidatus Poribacteria bacterium]